MNEITNDYDAAPVETLTLTSEPDAMKPARARRVNARVSMVVSAEIMQVREGTEKFMRQPETVAEECADMARFAQEAFCVITINARNRMIARHMVTLGLIDSCPVHPREFFRPAILDGAAACIAVHNHPSGDATPSAEDLRVTRQLVEASRILGIRILDHVIIGRATELRPGHLSLREKGLATFDGV
jgi:DNA repair protein RadC